MNTKLLQQQIAISILRMSGNKKLKSLLDSGESLDSFFNGNFKNDFSKLSKYNFANPSKKREALNIALDYLHYFQDNEMELLYYKGQDYPRRLEECEDAPLTLFKKGVFDLNISKVVAIVGTRNITDYGKKICEDLIQSFVGKNIIVISGLAYGVDAYIHELCLKHNVQTVGVLGHGFNFMYPASHRNLAKEIQRNGGLITEFLPDTHADRIYFPMRNRIIAGLADATIVVESGKKGGSLITADLANGYNRDVFAFPGRVHDEYSQGCNQLIKNNQAILINSANEFLEMMSWDNNIHQHKIENQPELFDYPNLNENELKVFHVIKKRGEIPKDELIHHFNHLGSELFGILLKIEMNRFIQSTARGTYKLV